MKGWTLLGIVLAVIGVILFLNGLNSRLTTGISSGIASRLNGTSSIPAVARKDSSAAPSAPVNDSVSVEYTEKTLLDTGEKIEKETEILKPSEKKLTVEKSPVPQPNPVQPANISPALPIAFDNDPDDRKKTLVKLLRDAKWSPAELEQLVDYLNDPRANFRGEILVRNSTFTENAEQYKHNLTNESISRSEKFLLDNKETLHFVQRMEGVPAEVLVAILKVETNLGEWRGKESVFNVYWSLALGDHSDVQRDLLTSDPIKSVEMRARMIKRAFWARGQLRDLLYVAKHGGENPVGILGSFAGAFGLPQFIPSSYRSFGQDGNGDGIVDLDAIPDAVRSIGYYLKENGWPNRPDRGRMRKSILSYNHSSFYADCVLTLSDSLSLRLNGAPLAN